LTTDGDTLAQELIACILAMNPLQSNFIAQSLNGIRADELDDLNSYLAFGLGRELSIEYLAECYDLIVKDTMREQLYFQRHGRYRYSSFKEVADAVYFDDEYMRRYMHGLALTAYLWPNHRSLHRYFIGTIPANRDGRYLEVGPGHGMYMMSAMRKSGYSIFDGIDISPTSVAMTHDLLESGCFGSFKNFRISLQDFLASDISRESCAAIVIGEVLEHVEDPGRFLVRTREIASDGAFIFITTPINAPAVDHIYLFESYDEIQNLVTGAGLHVVDSLLVPYPELSVEESMEQKLPVNVAMVLGK
jgi:2-polyprenyl-3-methyl-5-hydroxy-6-metoxy-1,4-benzoquinol methylase